MNYLKGISHIEIKLIILQNFTSNDANILYIEVQCYYLPSIGTQLLRVCQFWSLKQKLEYHSFRILKYFWDWLWKGSYFNNGNPNACKYFGKLNIPRVLRIHLMNLEAILVCSQILIYCSMYYRKETNLCCNVKGK